MIDQSSVSSWEARTAEEAKNLPVGVKVPKGVHQIRKYIFDTHTQLSFKRERKLLTHYKDRKSKPIKPVGCISL